MKEKIILAVFFIITALLLVFYLTYPPTTNGGDLVEYFGMTESLVKNASIHLTDEALGNLKNSLNPGYFTDLNTTEQNGGLLYYMKGRNGDLYPVHFFFYSLLALPVRVILKLFQLNELNTLRITNLIIFSITAFIVLKYFLTSNFKKIIFLLAFYLSPLVWFIIWPGPDIYYTCLLLISVFLFFEKKYFWSTALAALASWHSQPLVVLTLGLVGCYVFSVLKIESNEKKYLSLPAGALLRVGTVVLILLIPYLYSYFIFGVFTPWTILKDGWTQIYGFGMQNISLGKFFEQLLDPNLGLFWYMPVVFVMGLYFWIKAMLNKFEIRNSKSETNSNFLNSNVINAIFLLLIAIMTAFFYQTNPAWNYGTAGFGPTRHILFLIPFLIYFVVRGIGEIRRIWVVWGCLGLLVVSQLFVMSFNNFLTPNFMDSLNNSPMATYILSNYPRLYNPTPEIFVDRTNHTDLKFLKSAIYKKDDVCKKAYVLKTDVEEVKAECGFIPDSYESRLDNDLLRKANYSRKVKTVEATFWPDPGSCGTDFVPSKEQPYVCMKTIEDFVKNTGVTDLTRIKTVNNFDGVWRLEKGDVVDLMVPPGYIINHRSFEGIYVDF